jgi:hypothetical protein
VRVYGCPGLSLLDDQSGCGDGIDYALVSIRLFANLGAPTYLVVAGSIPTTAI